MNDPSILRDERTTAVENASYRLAYLVMSYGLLLIVTYRGFFLKQSSWDLLALAILGGVVATIYQGKNQIISRSWIKMVVAIFVISAILAAAVVLFLR